MTKINAQSARVHFTEKRTPLKHTISQIRPKNKPENDKNKPENDKNKPENDKNKPENDKKRPSKWPCTLY